MNNSPITKFTIFITLISLLVIFNACNSGTVADTGSGSELGNMNVSGFVYGLDSKPSQGVSVTILPKDYNPINKSGKMVPRETTTNCDGFYSFDSIPIDSVNIEMHLDTTACLALGVKVDNSGTKLKDTLKTTGRINKKVSKTKDLHSYIEGTTLTGVLHKDTLKFTGVPSGAIPKIVHIENNSNVTIADSGVVVKSDKVITLITILYLQSPQLSFLDFLYSFIKKDLIPLGITMKKVDPFDFNFNNARMSDGIIISNCAIANHITDISDTLQMLDKPIITLDPTYSEALGLSPAGSFHENDYTPPLMYVKIVKDSHGFPQNSSGSTKVFCTKSKIRWAESLPSATVICEYKPGTKKHLIYYYETNAQLFINVTPNRRLAFYIYDKDIKGTQLMKNWHSLFKEAAIWSFRP